MAISLSIIVPVYNVREYLEKCLDSLLNQRIHKNDYEIILVNDGSTDTCGSICDRYAQKNENVTVIHQANQGLSAARNAGLSLAQGENVMFVDSDDWIERDCLYNLIQTMINNRLDVLRFNYSYVKNGATISKGSITTSPVMTGEVFLYNELGFSCYACQFIIRRVFLLQNNLFFKPGIFYEDTEWTPRMLSCARRVKSIDTNVYFYRLREGSITSSSVNKRVEAQLSLIDMLKQQACSSHDQQWYKGMISHTVVTIISAVSTQLYEDRHYYLRRIKEKKVYPLSYFLSEKKKTRKILLINLSPQMACLFIHLNHLKKK